MNMYDKSWSMSEDIKDDIKSLGDYLQYATPMIFIIYEACFGDHNTARVFCITFVISLIIMSVLKALFNAPRPRETSTSSNPDLDLDWSPDEGNSFPSGHTMSAMVGGVFWFEIDPYVGVLGVACGLFTGLSRVIARAHWFRDVLTSTVIACVLYIVAKLWFL